MLVLSRKVHETIVIGDAIRVTVLATRGNQVRLGIEAAGDVRIMREELLPPVKTPADVPPPPSSLAPRRSPWDIPASC